MLRLIVCLVLVQSLCAQEVVWNRKVNDANCGIKWAASLAEAQIRAKAEGKPILFVCSAREFANPAAKDF